MCTFPARRLSISSRMDLIPRLGRGSRSGGVLVHGRQGWFLQQQPSAAQHGCAVRLLLLAPRGFRLISGLSRNRKGSKVGVLVVYESMYGNTHLIAEAIARGMPEAAALSVEQVAGHNLDGCELLVAGAPTVGHTLSHEGARRAAINSARRPDSGLDLDPSAEGAGLREWLESLGQRGGRAAAFDTRVDKPTLFTGRAAKTIGKLLHRHGYELVAEPESFLVGADFHLLPGEAERAEQWGRLLVARL
jgi:hypothetical protein